MNIHAWLDRWFPRPTRVLELCLLASLLIHAAVLAVRFVPAQRLDRLLNVDQLQIILVNALSNAPTPDQVQALSQTNLKGGGESPNKVMAASPLQRTAQNQAGLDGQSEEERKLEQIKAQQQQLVARIRTQLQQIPIPEPGESASEAAQKRQLMLKHLAELEKKIEQQNASPRTRFVGPSTKEVAYAEFYDQVRLRIEAHGTKHFPSFNGSKLYGSLTMVITIDAFGRVRDVQIAQGSGQPILDHKAVSIVHGSGPFEAFKPDLRKRVDQIAVVARFTFTREGEINSEVAAP
ncbi:MAG: hypothetical protein RL111_566 [Pseudomonadota bacterium]|jgi:protein TonB